MRFHVRIGVLPPASPLIRIARGLVLDRRKKVAAPRKVWRMTADAPLGELVDVDPARTAEADRRAVSRDETAAPAPVILDPARPASFHDSTSDLMRGCDVIDETDSIPGDLFDKLFNDTER
jgi:hypothetical protein